MARVALWPFLLEGDGVLFEHEQGDFREFRDKKGGSTGRIILFLLFIEEKPEGGRAGACVLGCLGLCGGIRRKKIVFSIAY